MNPLRRFGLIIPLVFLSHTHAAAHHEDSSGAATIAVASAVNISPASLVATGIADSNAATVFLVLSNIESATTERETLAAAKLAMDDAGADVTTLARALKLDPNNESLMPQYEVAVVDLASARDAYSNAQGALLDAAFDSLPTAQVEAFALWRSNATRSVPAEFRVLDMPEADWLAVERALRAERRSLRTGDPLDGEHTQLLQSVRADFSVVNAKYMLDAHLTAVETAFEQFSSE